MMVQWSVYKLKKLVPSKLAVIKKEINKAKDKNVILLCFVINLGVHLSNLEMSTL